VRLALELGIPEPEIEAPLKRYGDVKFLRYLICLIILSCQTPSAQLSTRIPEEKSRYERPNWVSSVPPGSTTGVFRLATVPSEPGATHKDAAPQIVSLRRAVEDIQLAVQQEEAWAAVRARHLRLSPGAPNEHDGTPDLQPEIIDIYFERLERNSSYDLYVLLQLAEPGNLE
jgi:hypothetical protein